MKRSYPPKLAYFSPLPPARSGIADYSGDLLPHLAPWADIHLFADAPVDPPIAWQFPVWQREEYAWRRDLHGYDCAIYHLGNNPLHAYVYPYVFSHPGIVVLHDLVLHHLFAWSAQYQGGAGTYLREMTYAHGGTGAAIGWDVLTGARPAPFFEYPLCERALDASLGVIVHSRYLEQQVQKLSPDAEVGVVSMGMPLGSADGDHTAIRRRLGLPEDAFIVGCLGEATHHKRLDVVMRAVARVPQAVLAIVGNVAPGLDLGLEVAKAGIGRRVRITGGVAPEQFQEYSEAVDVSVNLRYPTAGETSAAALRSLAAGLPTIVSDLGANQELPEPCVFKLPVGSDEEELLAAVLRWLMDDPARRSAFGEAGRRYIATEHAPERAAREYIAFVQTVLNAPVRVPAAGTGRVVSPFVAEVAGRMNEIGLWADNEDFLRELADDIRTLEE